MAKKQAPQTLLISVDDLAAADEGQFYHGHYCRNNYRKLIKINISLTFIALLLLAGAIVQKVFRGFPDYYLTSTDGGLYKIAPLNPPTSPMNNIFG